MKKFAVIGNPVKHSLSPWIHRQFAAQAGIVIEYFVIEAPIDEFKTVLLNFRDAGARGANITVPFKEQAYQLAKHSTDAVKKAHAANTLTFKGEEIMADNTDGLGFIKDITQNNHFNLAQKKILLLGAGGAARGIIAPLLEKNPAQLTIANRTEEKSKLLIDQFKNYGKITHCGFKDLNAPFDLIINSTSAGLTQNNLLLPAEIIQPNTFCYDLIYSKQDTPFLRWAKELGCIHRSDGFGMLVEQAAFSFLIWNGVMPNTKMVLQKRNVWLAPN